MTEGEAKAVSSISIIFFVYGLVIYSRYFTDSVKWNFFSHMGTSYVGFSVTRVTSCKTLSSLLVSHCCSASFKHDENTKSVVNQLITWSSQFDATSLQFSYKLSTLEKLKL